MIQRLMSLDSVMDFIRDVQQDPVFSDPMLATDEQWENNLLRSVKREDEEALVVYRDGELAGFFVFQITAADRNLEMIVGLSRQVEAYSEIADYLQEKYPGFQADFVFNPRNYLLREMLEQKGADFDPEQQKMSFSGEAPEVDAVGIVPLSDEYMEQYAAMHNTDMFWTAEKVAKRPDRFNVFLAVDHGKVVGYIDVTNCYGENEIYDILVQEEYRRKGWGRKLLGKALKENEPKRMMLLVFVDNEPAIPLYESMGFVKVEGQNSVTVFWHMP